MHELFLRFEDKAEAEVVLGSLGITVFDGRFPCDGMAMGVGFALDVLFGSGTIMRATGEMVETEFGPAPVSAPLAGYHVNLIWRSEEIPAELTACQINPVTPDLLWASV